MATTKQNPIVGTHNIKRKKSRYTNIENLQIKKKQQGRKDQKITK